MVVVADVQDEVGRGDKSGYEKRDGSSNESAASLTLPSPSTKQGYSPIITGNTASASWISITQMVALNAPVRFVVATGMALTFVHLEERQLSTWSRRKINTLDYTSSKAIHRRLSILMGAIMMLLVALLTHGR